MSITLKIIYFAYSYIIFIAQVRYGKILLPECKHFHESGMRVKYHSRFVQPLR